MHGLASGQESRQQLYTMLTRGRVANHVYVQVVGDGDPHTAIHPDTLAPPTATDILETILARDHSPVSATTQLRDAADPALLLGQATARYTDALHYAAEDLLGPDTVRRARTRRRPRRPRTDRPACLAHPARPPDPARRPRPRPPHRPAHRRVHAASSTPPTTPPPSSTGASTTPSRKPPTRATPAVAPPAPGRSPGSPASPQPWHSTRRGANTSPAEPNSSPPSPPRSRTQPTHGRPRGSPTPPPAPTPTSSPTCRSGGPPPRSPTPTCAPPGPRSCRRRQPSGSADSPPRCSGTRSPALQEWQELLHAAAPGIRRDDFTPILAERLAAISRAGLDARGLLRRAAAVAPLPDDHPAAALWWRLSRHLSPAVATDLDHHAHTLTRSTSWVPHLTATYGPARAESCRPARGGRRWSPASTTPSPAATASTRSPPWPAPSTRPSTSTPARPWCGACPSSPTSHPHCTTTSSPACRSTTLPRSRWRMKRTDGGHPDSGTAVEAPAPTDPARLHAPGDLDDPATADDPDHVRADLLATSRWGALADKIDRRLTAQSDWPALAAMLQNVHDAGHDVHDLTRQIVIDSPLGALPAQELRYRLVVWLPEPDRFVGEGAVNEWTSLRHVPPALNKPARLTIRSVR